MKLVFFGTPEFAVPTLVKLLQEPEFQVLAVVTQPDKRRGRGHQVVGSPVKAIALEHQLPVWQPKRIKKHPETLAALAATKADVFVVVAYGQILSAEILEMPKVACINGHGSLLPAYRGAAPIQWSLYHGLNETGITTIMMDEGMDTGAILLQANLSIDFLENAQSLMARMADLTADLIVQTLRKIQAGDIQPIPQNPALATYAPPIQKQDCLLNWQRSALDLHNQVRAFYPACITQFRGSLLKILATAPLGDPQWSRLPNELQAIAQHPAWQSLQEQPAQAPGTIVALLKGIGPILQTGDGYLLLREVQPSGKRPQSGSDFVNGMRLTPGEMMATPPIAP